jgi:hypothetical protein
VLLEWGLGALLVMAALASAVWGGGRERSGATVVALAGFATILMPETSRGGFVWGLLVLDLVCMAVLGRLAWKAPRAWPVWALAAQAVAAAQSLAYLMQPDVGPETWLRGLLIVRYGGVLAVLVGSRPKVQAQP